MGVNRYIEKRVFYFNCPCCGGREVEGEVTKDEYWVGDLGGYNDGVSIC